MEEADFEVPCSSIAVDSILRFSMAGLIWGYCFGPYDARKSGLTGIHQASFVVRSCGRYGLQCGLFAGFFSATRCRLQHYRMQKDWINASVAGAVTGAALAARTRSWNQVFSTAALLAFIAGTTDSS